MITGPSAEIINRLLGGETQLHCMYCANIFLSEAFVFDQEVKITFYLVHELQGRM